MKCFSCKLIFSEDLKDHKMIELFVHTKFEREFSRMKGLSAEFEGFSAYSLGLCTEIA